MFNADACCISSICVTHLKGSKNDTTSNLDCQKITGTGTDGGNRHLLYSNGSCATRQFLLLREPTNRVLVFAECRCWKSFGVRWVQFNEQRPRLFGRQRLLRSQPLSALILRIAAVVLWLSQHLRIGVFKPKTFLRFVPSLDKRRRLTWIGTNVRLPCRHESRA